MPAKGSLSRDLTGQRFGRLVAQEVAGRVRRAAIWLCRCDCGQTTQVHHSNLLQGCSKSCGCLRREVTRANSTTHGQSGRSPEYQSWASMLARVRSTRGRRDTDYRQRGITVCERWHSFENFLADMGPRPAGRSLDRIDNDGNYEPSNCRWATASEQVRNRRSPERVKADRGQTSASDPSTFRKTTPHPELSDASLAL